MNQKNNKAYTFEPNYI